MLELCPRTYYLTVKGEFLVVGYLKKMFETLKLAPPSVMTENSVFNAEEV